MRIVVHLPFRCGSTRTNSYDSWMRVRISAFISAAALDPAVQMLRVGGPAAGFVEPTNSQEHEGAQFTWRLNNRCVSISASLHPFGVTRLTGCAQTLVSEWRLLSAARCPGKMELGSGEISALPRMGSRNFDMPHAPNVTYGRFAAVKCSKLNTFRRGAGNSKVLRLRRTPG